MSGTEYQIPANGVAEGENKIDIDSSSSGIDSKRDSSDDSFSEVCDEHNETIINLTQFNKNTMNHSNGHDSFEDVVVYNYLEEQDNYIIIISFCRYNDFRNHRLFQQNSFILILFEKLLYKTKFV